MLGTVPIQTELEGMRVFHFWRFLDKYFPFFLVAGVNFLNFQRYTIFFALSRLEFIQIFYIQILTYDLK